MALFVEKGNKPGGLKCVAALIEGEIEGDTINVTAPPVVKDRWPTLETALFQQVSAAAGPARALTLTEMDKVIAKYSLPDKGEIVIPLMEAIIHIQASNEEEGKLLFSKIEEDAKAWEATPSAPTRVTCGSSTDGYYAFFVRLPMIRFNDFKDFLRHFCKERKILINL